MAYNISHFLSATFPGVYGQTIFQQQQLQRQPQKEGMHNLTERKLQNEIIFPLLIER